MSAYDGLPDTRTSLRGLTEEGDEAWLIRGISQKLYRCPACGGAVEIGADHVIVQYVRRIGGTEHQHWHRRCVDEILIYQLRNLQRVSALESTRERLERRAQVKPGRRRRHLRRR
ncbi:MAG TPA: hypothetical protein VIL04_12805 [Solirubrobacterales bacterium]|jgi:hypothetical protein